MTGKKHNALPYGRCALVGLLLALGGGCATPSPESQDSSQAGVPVATPLHAPEVDRKRSEAQQRLGELAARHFGGLEVDAVAVVGTSAAEAIACE